MKRARILQTVCTLASLMMFAACTQDEPTDGNGASLPDGKYPIAFSAAVDGQAATRATTDNTWTGGEEIAIQIGNEVKKYKAASNGNLAIADGSTPFYWQNTGSINIAAWYPYSDSCPEQWTVKANQNTSDNYQASDLIKGELALAFTDKDDPEKNKITFQHQTAKVIVRLSAGVGGVVLDANTAVRLLNVGGVEGGETTVTPYRPNNQEQTYLALVNGQTIQANENFIQVSTGGNHYYYKPKEIKTLSGGMVYTYDITVKNSKLEVTVSESIAWGTGNTGSGSVAEIPDINLSSLTEDYTISGDGEYLVIGSSQYGLIINGSPTVRLREVAINTTNITNRPAIKVESGSPVIVLEGENSFTASDRNESVISLAGSDANVTIEGGGNNAGSLTINHNASNVILSAIIGGNSTSDAGDITIQNATLKISATHNVNSGIIGSGFSWSYEYSRCGNIEIKNTDLTIEIMNNKRIAGAYIGCGMAQVGNTTCGDITIRLKKDESKSTFLNKLTDFPDAFTGYLQKPDKVGKGSIYISGTSTCGTVTWYDSNGHIIQ